MIKFKQFLFEVFTNPYPHKKYGNKTYSFKTPNDVYSVGFSHQGDTADICFDSEKNGFHRINNEERGHSHRVFSTIHNIMKTHLEDNPHIKKVTFDTWNKYPSRVKLYDRLLSTYTKKHERHSQGGENNNTYFSFDRDDIRENYNILSEELVPKVYHNISPRTLMNLSKEHENTRFVIDGNDRIHAGHAGHFIHSDLYPSDKEVGYYNKLKFRGAVMTYNKKTGKHVFGGYNSPDHPIINKLKEYGAIHGRREGDWGDLTAVENTPAEPTPKYDKRGISYIIKGLRTDK